MLAGIIILSICFGWSNSQLQSSYDKLSKNHSQLQEEVKKLKEKIEEKCPDRWTRFGSSCYFKSHERKTWSDSRRDCQDKGADLVMINSKEEQEFINELNMRGESWIGLRAKQTSGGYKWEWVDGSAVNETLWQGIQAVTQYRLAPTSYDGDTTLEELNKCYAWFDELNNTQVKKATLRGFTDQLANVFSDIFNSSLSQMIIPACFNTTTIIPVPKKFSVSSLNDYRHSEGVLSGVQDIYAEPDLSTKVRYSRKEQEDRAEWEQREVDTYESADEIRDSYDHFQSQEGGPQTQSPPSVQKGSFRCATLALRVLCLLMLAGIIILSICFGWSNSQLQSSYDKLSKNHSQLQEEVKKLKEKIEEKCPDRWTRFGSSCYFKSTESKTWSESRRDCQDKGADLVMINSKEEQEFVNEFGGFFWIGLTAKQTSGGSKWEWVDGSALTETFWAKGHEIPSYGYYGVCCDSDGKWTQSPGYNFGDRVSKTFICEK
ncbi:uncharacterized protein LOC116318446 [Oreochromis aureus]|uniref:uncharacterized protein LOC116318446 n=1 Tax=Oreochromis aureus TaxID=47969 RepID=UPI001954968A|nr:uncharacterized protein LOC116318446 [Oreochromis aureus]